MKVTNNRGIPHQVVSAIVNDDYNPGKASYTATTLLKPPRIVQLRKRYESEIVIDASDMIWALLGKIGHKILERADDTGSFHEERLHAHVGNSTISCQTDNYSTKKAAPGVWTRSSKPKFIDIPPTISDYKFIKIQAAKYNNPDWEKQLNINAWIWMENGFPVENLEIVAIFRDWSLMEANRSADYPHPIEVYKQRLWEKKELDIWIKTMVELHNATRDLTDELLPFCTPEDQWRRETVHKVKYPTKKRSIKNFTDIYKAFELAEKLGGDHYVESVPGEAIRCLYFCDVRRFCNQFRLEHPNYEENR